METMVRHQGPAKGYNGHDTWPMHLADGMKLREVLELIAVDGWFQIAQ
jgi:hypothetical protein